ncbi:hypothetical protein [Sphingobium nicotianae]|uniref:DUF1440 domain-containing protein n=1 Tax=Sphingobium nicotianae TaxID=2782607 RepID=A0A9X1IQ97_9SPHN|nr:hypothetical protein [Sphingobium nicotianae]MBT2186613.1 hypothetical protein [Sphingobium nicotianae]
MRGYFWKALAICGTLDIGYAMALAMALGGRPGGVLRSVAAGPFGPQVLSWGISGPLAGLAVHYAIMAVMVAVFGLIAGRGLLDRVSPWIAGPVYGLILYLVMYWMVLPLRWPATQPTLDPATVASALFAHIVLVGLPMALIARRSFRKVRKAPVHGQ